MLISCEDLAVPLEVNLDDEVTDDESLYSKLLAGTGKSTSTLSKVKDVSGGSNVKVVNLASVKICPDFVI